MTVKQISVFVENKPGMLAALADVLNENVLRIIKNAVKWAAPSDRKSQNIPCTNPAPLEKGNCTNGYL